MFEHCKNFASKMPKQNKNLYIDISLHEQDTFVPLLNEDLLIFLKYLLRDVVFIHCSPVIITMSFLCFSFFSFHAHCLDAGKLRKNKFSILGISNIFVHYFLHFFSISCILISSFLIQMSLCLPLVCLLKFSLVFLCSWASYELTVISSRSFRLVSFSCFFLPIVIVVLECV